MSRVRVINEVDAYKPGDWNLWFQHCQYIYDDGSTQFGYRFIWRRPDGSLQPARGQARIPSIEIIKELIKKAKEQGWGDHDYD